MTDFFHRILSLIAAYWTSGLEILILSTILYYIYLYLRGTHGARILIGLALVFLTLTFISQVLDLAVLGWLLRSFSVFMAIALVVLFQPELRRALNELGSHRFFSTALQRREAIEEITDTVFDLSSKGFGALIALERDLSLKSVAESGVEIDAEFSKELLLTIFQPKTVLHDGGVILSGDRIVAAGCIFPLTQRDDLDRTIGLRHRAGLGLSEESDTIALVVSEESGQVSICHSGSIERNLNVERFRKRLSQLLIREENHANDPAAQLEGETGLPASGGGALVSHSSKPRPSPGTQVAQRGELSELSEL
ncbi:MAG: diadenylate cyclase CdaA [Verrucomicrobia bacterium]|nr:diadenylate cyclase CdaA [Verrucomicrobiota bacterium]